LREPLRLTKAEAAARQINAAIDAFERGDFDVCVTLSGAAEGMLPELPGQPLFSTIRSNPKAVERYGEKGWVSRVNEERDWLKHLTPQLPSAIEIAEMDAGLMFAPRSGEGARRNLDRPNGDGQD